MIANPPAIPPPEPGTPNPIQLEDAGQAEYLRVRTRRTWLGVDLYAMEMSPVLSMLTGEVRPVLGLVCPPPGTEGAGAGLGGVMGPVGPGPGAEPGP